MGFIVFAIVATVAYIGFLAAGWLGVFLALILLAILEK